jgi:hypothetical protein
LALIGAERQPSIAKTAPTALIDAGEMTSKMGAMTHLILAAGRFGIWKTAHTAWRGFAHRERIYG